MKKLIVLISLTFLLAIPLKASAADVFGFMDGKFYDVNAILKYICFLDGNCYDTDLKPAPFKIVPVSYSPAVDVCPNIEGSQSVIPVGLVNKDGNCVVPDPVSVQPIAGGYVAPPDTTAPSILQCYYWVVTVNSPHEQKACSYPGSPLSKSQNAFYSNTDFKAIYLFTNEPVTVKYTFFAISDNQGNILQELLTPGSTSWGDYAISKARIGTGITYEDMVLSDSHKINYVNAGLIKGVSYLFKIEYTDKVGNKSGMDFGGQSVSYSN